MPKTETQIRPNRSDESPATHHRRRSDPATGGRAECDDSWAAAGTPSKPAGESRAPTVLLHQGYPSRTKRQSWQAGGAGAGDRSVARTAAAGADRSGGFPAGWAAAGADLPRSPASAMGAASQPGDGAAFPRGRNRRCTRKRWCPTTLRCLALRPLPSCGGDDSLQPSRPRIMRDS